MNPRTNFRLQRLSVWCGIFVAVGAIIAYYVVGHLSPPSPTTGADEIKRSLVENRTGILWCVVLMNLIAPFFYFFAVVTSMQMKRIEGGWGLLSMVQVTTAVVAPTGWVYPLAGIAALVYRTDRSPELYLMFSDLYWLTYVGVAFIFSINIFSIGLAALVDKRTDPVFPRWTGWANIVFAVAFAPGVFVYAFQTGPLTFNGFFAMMIPSIAFPLWKIMMTYVLLRAIKQEEREFFAADRGGTTVPATA